jgi:hypothetical protein
MNFLNNSQIINELLEIRRSLIMWNMSLEGVDRLLDNFGYTGEREKAKEAKAAPWPATNVQALEPTKAWPFPTKFATLKHKEPVQKESVDLTKLI